METCAWRSFRTQTTIAYVVSCPVDNTSNGSHATRVLLGAVAIVGETANLFALRRPGEMSERQNGGTGLAATLLGVGQTSTFA